MVISSLRAISQLAAALMAHIAEWQDRRHNMVRHIVNRNALMRLRVRPLPLVERTPQTVALLGRGRECSADIDKLRVQRCLHGVALCADAVQFRA